MSLSLGTLPSEIQSLIVSYLIPTWKPSFRSSEVSVPPGSYDESIYTRFGIPSPSIFHINQRLRHLALRRLGAVYTGILPCRLLETFEVAQALAYNATTDISQILISQTRQFALTYTDSQDTALILARSRDLDLRVFPNLCKLELVYNHDIRSDTDISSGGFVYNFRQAQNKLLAQRPGEWVPRDRYALETSIKCEWEVLIFRSGGGGKGFFKNERVGLWTVLLDIEELELAFQTVASGYQGIDGEKSDVLEVCRGSEWSKRVSDTCQLTIQAFMCAVDPERAGWWAQQ